MSIQLSKPEYLVVYVSDMQRSVAFYRDLVGLPLKFTTPGWSELETGSITLALHRGNGEPLPAQGRSPIGAGQLVFTVENIQATYEEMKASGVNFSMPPQRQASGIMLATFHDPDGFGIALQERQEEQHAQ